MNGAREKISQPMTSDNIQPLWELEIRVQGARIFPSSHLYYIYIYVCVYHMIYIYVRIIFIYVHLPVGTVYSRPLSTQRG